MKACIITIGNEILKGKTINTNAAEIGRMLFFSGYEVFRGMIVPDTREEIGSAFRSMVDICDVIVSSGGLGPTFDDITVSSFAHEFGIPLRIDKETYDRIRARAEKRGAKMSPEREKMAQIPEGAKIIKNEVGSAPGIEYQLNSKRVFILPGVPPEMRSMLEHIRNEVQLPDTFYSEKSILIDGIFEASLAPYITELMNKYRGSVYIKSHPIISPGIKESRLEIEVTAKSDNTETSSNLVETVLKEIGETAVKLRGLTHSG